MFTKKDIYLCIQCNNINEKFKCYKFNNYYNADNYYKKNFLDKQYKASSLIPVCSYIPNYLHKYVLEYKIYKLFTNVEICSKITTN